MRKRTMNINFAKAYRSVLVAFVMICAMIGLLCYMYYSSLSVTIKQESRAYLKELSNRIANDIERIVKDNVAVLNTIATSLEESSKTTLAQMKPLIAKQKVHFNYKELYLVDKDGTAHGIEQSIPLNLDNNIKNDILSGKSIMSTTQIINNKEFILFSVPIQNLLLDDKQIVALLGCYDPAEFNDVLSLTSFNKRSYSQIVTKTGTVITRPTSEYDIKGEYNIISALKTAKMEKGYSVEKLQEELSLDSENQITFTLDGVQRYMIFTPLTINGWYLFNFVPVAAVNQRSEALLRTTVLVCGIIMLTFATMVAALVFVFIKHKSRLEKLAFIDSITGGNTMQRFNVLADIILNKNQDKQFALIFINVEKFKIMNEQIGRAACDEVLRAISKILTSAITDYECMCRIFADNFCMIIEYTNAGDLLNRFHLWYSIAEKYLQDNNIKWQLPTLQMGIYLINDTKLSFEQMIDRAKLGSKDTSWAIDNKLEYGYYDDEVRRVLFREKQLEDRMISALAANEFKVYLQPKYMLPSETIGGAEALVRWESANEGMIYPNEFIPLFEKNGFIVQIDLWMFEQVCICLQSWVDRGFEPIKISVNCSRVHFKDPNFLDQYTKIADKHGVDRSMLEIELTESIVMENSSRLTQIISGIKSAGFCCSMDDFGSGYSSLNMLQSIPVDTLKLDRIFFSQNYEPKRTEALIRSIVMMAESLNMDTVAEGVEQREQVEMLKRAGCQFIQGYVFAKPMCIEDFEKLTFLK